MPPVRRIDEREIVDWLVNSHDPAVRLAALKELEGLGESEPELVKATEEAMGTGPISKILQKQCPGGFWGIEKEFYNNSKYRGTVWNFNLLAQLGADGSDTRIRSAAEFLLKSSQHDSGGFSNLGNARGGTAGSVLPCLTGNMTWSMLRFGLKNDERVQAGLDWIVKYQRFDDNDGEAPKGWPYSSKSCWGRHTCHMGVIKGLKAISAISEEERSGDQIKVVSEGAEYMLKHHLYKRSHDPSAIAKTRWTQLGFPLFWDTDVLEMLEVLTDLGCRDDRMEDAIELVLSKRMPDGRWRNERSYAGRLLTNIERQGAPSQWVTLKALVTLKKLGRLD